MKKQILILFTILFTSPVYAPPQLIGQISCEIFLSECDKNMLNINCQTQTWWAMGFISGFNQYEIEEKYSVGEGMNSVTIKYALIKFCRDNPLENTANASYDVYQKLLKRKTR